ncbi:MAG: lincomycin resistance protein LmrB [Propionibacterium sp.]|nr:MAG: lincomycin resistance protein LmrB [Propionibacterium sp.]
MDTTDTTPVTEVLAVVNWLTSHSVVYQINGGWGVDALVGRQTRTHRDLDVFVDAEFVADLLSWLESRGYIVVEDWLPIRIEMASPQGRVDVHPMKIDADGNGVQRGFGENTFLHLAAERTTGSIGGTEVVAASKKHQQQLHEGYELREVDHHDLAILDQVGVDAQ